MTSLGSTAAKLNVAPSANCRNPGDEIMLINLQGTGANHNNTGSYAYKWDFGYDGDGNRVSTLLTTYANGQVQSTELTAYYFGGAYETQSDGTIRKYYSFAGQTIAVFNLTPDTLSYFLTDHLGSIVVITDASGTLTSQQRYLPFGQLRADITGPQLPITDLGYTGQRSLGDDLGLMDYRARFYHPILARFIQPDTMIPDPSNPQAFNRYSYVMNRPTIYTDPSGYCPGLKPGKKCAANPKITGPVISIPPTSTPAPTPASDGVPTAPPIVSTGTPTPNSILSTIDEPEYQWQAAPTVQQLPYTICLTPQPGQDCTPTALGAYPSYSYHIGIDWSKVDLIDLATDVGGLIGEGTKFLGVPGVLVYGASQIGEATNTISKIKAVWDLGNGDLSGMIFQTAGYIIEGGGKLSPAGGFLNAASIIYNFKDAIYIYRKEEIYVAPYDP